MTAYADLESLRSLNGGTSMYLAHLKHQVGKTGLNNLREKWTQLIDDERIPLDLKMQLRTLRLMSRELDDENLAALSEAYQTTEPVYRSLVEGHRNLQDALGQAQLEWEATIEPGQKAMSVLNDMTREWGVQAWPDRRALSGELFRPYFHNIPNKIADYDEREIRQERTRFLEMLDWRLATHESMEGVEEMEVLDATLARLHAIWDNCHQQLAGAEDWGPQFDEAKRNFDQVKREIGTELGQKLPESGQFAMVRMARRLWQADYEDYRPDFEWLLTREDSNGLLRSTWRLAEPRPAITVNQR